MGSFLWNATGKNELPDLQSSLLAPFSLPLWEVSKEDEGRLSMQSALLHDSPGKSCQESTSLPAMEPWSHTAAVPNQPFRPLHVRPQGALGSEAK